MPAFVLDHCRLPLWIKMGQPLYLTPKQVAELKPYSELEPESINLQVVGADSVAFEVTVEAQSLVNVIIQYLVGLARLAPKAKVR